MSHKIAIVWRGDAVSRAAATPQNNRYHQIISELAAFGIEAEPAVYGEEMHDEVRAQLLKVDGVLVWVNPLEGDRSREKLDPMLREVAAAGRFVSAHPDTILKMGTKEILYRTRHLGWGTETLLYRTVEELRCWLVFAREGRASSSRTAATLDKESGKSNGSTSPPTPGQSSECWRHDVAARRRRYGSRNLFRVARPISAGAAASSINPFRPRCPME
jgi:hypothetical protein